MIINTNQSLNCTISNSSSCLLFALICFPVGSYQIYESTRLELAMSHQVLEFVHEPSSFWRVFGLATCHRGLQAIAKKRHRRGCTVVVAVGRPRSSYRYMVDHAPIRSVKCRSSRLQFRPMGDKFSIPWRNSTNVPRFTGMSKSAMYLKTSPKATTCNSSEKVLCSVNRQGHVRKICGGSWCW